MVAIRKGAVIAGKYELERSLGRGGMGSVWAARHILLDTPLAIKFIGADITARAEVRRRFEREAKAAARLQSTNVVHIHDYGIEGDHPYIVMELLEGEDLSVRLARMGRLPVEEVAEIVIQVARALRRASEAGIVHRDLKPGNIFLVQGDDDGEVVKVLDFGVAKTPKIELLEDTTEAGTLIGSPRYMSPEQARASRKVDHRSDLWSLAVIAYRAITGQLPFRAEELGEIIVKICTEDAPRPSSLVPDLDPELDEFFARALDRDPDKRFQTARGLAAAFADAAGLQPPPSTTFRRSRTGTSDPRMPAVKISDPQLVRSDPELPRVDPSPASSDPEPRPDPAAAISTVREPAPAAVEWAPEIAKAAPIAAVEVECTRRSSQPEPAPAGIAVVARSSNAAIAVEIAAEPHPENTPPTLTGCSGIIEVPPRPAPRVPLLRGNWYGVLGFVGALLLGGAVWLWRTSSRSDPRGPLEASTVAQSAAGEATLPPVPPARPPEAPPKATPSASAVPLPDATATAQQAPPPPALRSSGSAIPTAAPRKPPPNKKHSVFGI